MEIRRYEPFNGDSKKDIIKKVINYLIDNNIDFSIENSFGSVDVMTLDCPMIDLELDLEVDESHRSCTLMAHFDGDDFIVNSFKEIMDEINKRNIILASSAPTK